MKRQRRRASGHHRTCILQTWAYCQTSPHSSSRSPLSGRRRVRILDNIAGCRDVEELVQVWENAVRIFRQSDSLNMDRKQVLINIVAKLCKIN